MRTMEIPGFPDKRRFSDLEGVFRTRLTHRRDAYASFAIPLLGYMAWPNDELLRQDGMKMFGRWLQREPEPIAFRSICEPWAHVADIVTLHYGLSYGGHQDARGGASVGKAIYLASALIKNRGAGQATLWRHWQIYRDVAHLVAATTLVCFLMQRWHRQAPFGLGLQEFHPLTVIAMVPDLILAVGLAYESYGSNTVAKGGLEPMLNPETVWRVPADINVEALSPFARKIGPSEKVILNGRRAGNRGRAKHHRTTLISA